jgi:hypothetical protein
MYDNPCPNYKEGDFIEQPPESRIVKMSPVLEGAKDRVKIVRRIRARKIVRDMMRGLSGLSVRIWEHTRRK